MFLVPGGVDLLFTPYPRSYWVMPGRLLAGYYPGAPDPVEAAGKLQALFDVGIRCIVNLMEPDERDYRHGCRFTDYSGTKNFSGDDFSARAVTRYVSGGW